LVNALIEHGTAPVDMDLKAELEKSVGSFMVKNLLTVDESETATRAAKSMTENRVGALVATRRGEPVGVVTERDVLNKVVAAEKDPSKTRVSSIMSSPIRTIDQGATAADAIALMAKLGIRRLGVTRSGKIVGLVSQRSIVSSGTGDQVLLPELEVPEGLRCPYCLETMRDPKELSRHIDLVHIGKGLLEGDVRKI
jgi:CBS domain-containing protein